MVLPMTTRDNERIRILSAENAMTAIVVKPITEIPAASPSNPSIKLIAFVIPTIHSTVRGYAIHPNSSRSVKKGTEKKSIFKPVLTIKQATRTCTRNLNFALKLYLSSNIPKMTMSTAPTDIAVILLCRNSPPASAPAATPIKIAKPPILGITLS